MSDNQTTEKRVCVINTDRGQAVRWIGVTCIAASLAYFIGGVVSVVLSGTYQGWDIALPFCAILLLPSVVMAAGTFAVIRGFSMSDEQTTAPWPILDRVAARVGVWALRRLYGADCATDVRDDFPGEDVQCLSCEATRLVKHLQEIARG